MTTTLEAINLTKKFANGQVAVNNLSFSVEEGEILGLLGPNGAGKTSTIRLFNGILNPTSGNIKVAGIPVNKNQKKIRQICGVMTETAAPYENLTPFENLIFFGRMHNLLQAELEERINWLLTYFGLTDARNKKVKHFSSGMKKKLLLSIALLHKPSVLFLDEPTASLDPEASRDVNNLIKSLAQEHKITVLLCTHQLKYAKELCTLYAFLDKGKLTGFGTYNQLLDRKDKSTYLEIRGKEIPESLGFIKDNGIYKKVVKDDLEVSGLIAKIIDGGGCIYEAHQQQPDLEDLYFLYLKK